MCRLKEWNGIGKACELNQQRLTFVEWVCLLGVLAYTPLSVDYTGENTLHAQGIDRFLLSYKYLAWNEILRFKILNPLVPFSPSAYHMHCPSALLPPNPDEESDKCAARRRSVPQKVRAVERGAGKQGAQIKSTPLPAGHSSSHCTYIRVCGTVWKFVLGACRCDLFFKFQTEAAEAGQFVSPSGWLTFYLQRSHVAFSLAYLRHAAIFH